MNSKNSASALKPSTNPRQIQQWYIALSAVCSTTLSGIFIGIASAAVVNILTGEKTLNWRFALASAAYFVVIYLLYCLINFRKDLDDEESLRKAAIASARERWMLSCGWENHRKVKIFFCLFFSIAIVFSIAVWMNGRANNTDAVAADRQNTQISNTINNLNKELGRLNSTMDSMVQEQHLSIKRLDSLNSILHHTLKK